MAEGTKVGEAHVDIVANLSGLKKDLARVKSQMKSLGAASSGLAGKLTAVFTGISAAIAGMGMVGRILGGVLKMLVRIVDFIVSSVVAAFKLLGRIVGTVFSAMVAGAKAAFRALQSLGGFLYSSMRVAADFRHEMTFVGTILSATKADVDRLSTAALELGKKTEFMASEAAEAMQVMARAGLDVNTIIKETGVVLDFATANQIELADSAESLIGITRGMGIELRHFGAVADIIAMTAKSSTQDVGMLTEAFRNVAPVANAFGQDIRVVAGALGVLANNADTGSRAGTHLRMALVKLSEPKATKAFEKMGISLRDAGNRMRPIRDIIAEFNNVIPAAQRADKAIELFGTESAMGFITLSNAGVEAMDVIIEKASNAMGTIAKMASELRATVERSFDIVGSSWEAFQIAIGDIFGPATLEVNTFLTHLLNRLTHLVKKWTPYLQGVISDFLGWIAKEGPAVLEAILGTIHFVFNEIMRGFAVVKNFIGQALSGGGGFFADWFGLDQIREGAGPVEAFFTVILNLFGMLKLAWKRLMVTVEDMFATMMIHIEYGLRTAPMAAAGAEDIRDIRSIVEKGMRGEEVTQAEKQKVQDYQESRGFWDWAWGDTVEAWTGLSNKYMTTLDDWDRDLAIQARKAKQNQLGLDRPDITTATEEFPLGLTPTQKMQRENAKIIAEMMQGLLGESADWAKLLVEQIITLAPPDTPEPPKPLPPPAPPPPGGPPPGAGAAAAATGTISTVFGQMKVAVNDEVRLLKELVVLNRRIANNTRTVTMLPLT